MCGTKARHVLALIDGVPIARLGISNGVDIGQIPVSLVQRVEYILGPVLQYVDLVQLGA